MKKCSGVLVLSVLVQGDDLEAMRSMVTTIFAVKSDGLEDFVSNTRHPYTMILILIPSDFEAKT
ncbi:MAG TPA: hypothetical protein VK737_07490, partial [Opitutales bacterium]|nr:hypothetical protein [Opitutales bacterium]